MSYICDNCGKKTVVGRSQRHRRGIAGKRWIKRAQATPRLFRPNLQKFEGKRLCTKCIKRLKKNAQSDKLR